MHPALRTGPLFYKNTPPPISFPAYGTEFTQTVACTTGCVHIHPVEQAAVKCKHRVTRSGSDGRRCQAVVREADGKSTRASLIFAATRRRHDCATIPRR